MQKACLFIIKIPMNVSLDHMTVPLTLSAATLRAHSHALARQDFLEMAKYVKVRAVHVFFYFNLDIRTQVKLAKKDLCHAGNIIKTKDVCLRTLCGLKSLLHKTG